MILKTNRLGFIKSIIIIYALIFSFAQSAEFHEEASTIISASLQKQPSNSFLKSFYSRLYFVPVWTHEDNLSNFSIELLKQIDADKSLEQDSKIRQDALAIYAKNKSGYTDLSMSQKITLEFEIAELYKEYVDYLLNGNINWSAFKGKLVNPKNEEEINGGWITYGSPFNSLNIMEDAIVNGSLADTLNRAAPKGFNYDLMYNELIKYMEIRQNGGWAKIPAVKGSIKIGQSNSAIPDIRERLRLTGELGNCNISKTSQTYDACLQKAIMKFQKNNGISPNGIIDKKTSKALGENVDQRISKIRLNMDRIKWLNHRLEQRNIIINIPDFKFSFIENNKLRKEMKVIVGDKKHRTPIFSNRLSIIILNPYWNVPQSIIQKEYIPKLLKNPHALTKEHIDVTVGWDRNEPKIDPTTIDWSQYQFSKTVPFRFAQPPGDGNALGKIKFLFPNNFAVYMHDTPTKKLFNEDVRAFSHGCIRLSEPMELLKIIASIDSGVNLERANEILKGKTETSIGLKQSIPVDIVYLTSWVDYNGTLQFRDDIYDYDVMQKN
ncbi:MAG: L,D-transpeptidase family protein [Sulfurovaceae bacterium]|nr:L,D-transpeptidase family protein [Sulfurovaceae bacterium]